jgi:hypothetical protein
MLLDALVRSTTWEVQGISESQPSMTRVGYGGEAEDLAPFLDVGSAACHLSGVLATWLEMPEPCGWLETY